jgi:uncharacterized repeat protein (TIGR03803 family)
MNLPKSCAISLLVVAVQLGVAGGQTITFANLYNFSNTDGNQPLVGMIQGADGNLYGTTSLGGTSTNCPPFGGCGTVFKISPSGLFTNLHNFSGTDGSMPQAPLIQGRDGYFYGVAIYGGTGGGFGNGTIFRVSSSGAFTNLWFFTSGTDGDHPSSIVQGNDGYLYGVTIDGAANFDGAAFKISTNGNLTPLATFDDTTNGRAILLSTDGYFYGTSPGAGPSGNGSVFRMSTAGVVTNLYFFTGGSGGATPRAGLTQGNDGNFYGTTAVGGTFGSGTVFRITSSGSLTTLHNFGGNDGAGPWSALVLGSDGQFYGTTSIGGSALCNGGCGTVFRISTNGTFKTLRFLNGTTDGDAPYGGLVQGYDGKFYGVDNEGGTGYGTLFKLFVALNPAANQINTF